MILDLLTRVNGGWSLGTLSMSTPGYESLKLIVRIPLEDEVDVNKTNKQTNK